MHKKIGLEDAKNRSLNLSLDDAVLNKSWSVRKNGYEAAATLFKKLEPNSPKWDHISGLLEAIQGEVNLSVKEKGLEAVLSFAENCPRLDDRLVLNILDNIAAKYLCDNKARIRELTTQICMVLIAQKKHKLVIEFLLSGLADPQNTHVFTYIRMLTKALIVYGPNIGDIEEVTKKVVELCVEKSHLQNDLKDLFREIYVWVGPSIRDHLSSLDSAQLNTLELEFAKVDYKHQTEKLNSSLSNNSKPSSTDSGQLQKMNLKSVTRKKSTGKGTKGTEKQCRPATSGNHTSGNPRYNVAQPTVRARSSNSALTKRGHPSKGSAKSGASNRGANVRPPAKIGFNEIFILMESKQWSDRRTALQALHDLLSTSGNSQDCNKILKSLRNLIITDTNIILVSKAVQCVAVLARKNDQTFKQHAPLLLTLLLEKFKEKKSIIVDALRDATDAIYESTAFGSIVRYITISLENQNPTIKAEAELFLSRCYSRPNQAILERINWEPLLIGLVKNLTNQDKTVRDNSMQAIGTMQRSLGDEPMLPFLGKVQKHQMSTIYNYCQDAIVEYKWPTLGLLKKSSEQLLNQTNKDRKDSNNKNLFSDYSSGCSSATLATDNPTKSNKDMQHYAVVNQPLIRANTRIVGDIKPNENPTLYNQDFQKGIVQHEAVHNQHRPKSPSTQKYPSTGTSPQRDTVKTKHTGNTLNSTHVQLKSLCTKIETFRTMFSEIQKRPNDYNAPRNIELEIKNKLDNLENNIDTCYVDIKELAPRLYEQLTRAEGNSSITQQLNSKLNRMEYLVHSMRFDEKWCPGPSVIGKRKPQ